MIDEMEQPHNVETEFLDEDQLDKKNPATI